MVCPVRHGASQRSLRQTLLKVYKPQPKEQIRSSPTPRYRGYCPLTRSKTALTLIDWILPRID